MKKPVIIHFIYDLGCGGAEKMLVESIPYLKLFDHILVTLNGRNDFDTNPFSETYNLNCPSTWTFPMAIIRLRKIIRKVNPDIVHSHLPLPNIIARLSTPTRIPLYTHIHTTPSESIAYSKPYLKFLEKWSYSFRAAKIIGVSKGVIADYCNYFRISYKNCLVIYTYANEATYKPSEKSGTENISLKLVTVGIKPSKNLDLILDALIELNDQNISLDIYGTGNLPPQIKQVERMGLPVNFKGQNLNLEKVLPQYDIYISASRLEGFSLSILEAMSCKLALVLSDINSFKEQADDTALYFSLNDKMDITRTLKHCINNRDELKHKTEIAHQRFLNNFTLAKYIERLAAIYRNSK